MLNLPLLPKYIFSTSPFSSELASVLHYAVCFDLCHLRALGFTVSNP